MNFNLNQPSVSVSTLQELDALNLLYDEALRCCTFEPEYMPIEPEILLTQGNVPEGAGKDSFKMYSCYCGDELAAYITLCYGYPEKSSVSVLYIYVAEKYRGTGFGRVIINYLCGSFNQLGYHCFHVTVSLKNVDALKFWVKNGFSKIVSVSENNNSAEIELIRENKII